MLFIFSKTLALELRVGITDAVVEADGFAEVTELDGVELVVAALV